MLYSKSSPGARIHRKAQMTIRECALPRDHELPRAGKSVLKMSAAAFHSPPIFRQTTTYLPVSVRVVPSGATVRLYVPRSSAMSPDAETMICSGAKVRAKPGVCIIDAQVRWIAARPLAAGALGGITALERRR